MRTKARMPEKATDTVPGSAEKVEVMQKRLQAGEELFHPKDLVLGEEIISGNYRNFFAKLLFSLDEEDQTEMLKLWNLT